MTSIGLETLIGAYNVHDFGALGDGTGDDGPAFNRAITTATQQADSGVNGPVFVPPGIYRIATTVSVLSSVTLLGLGSRSILRLAPSTVVDAVDVLRSVGTSNIRIRDLRIDGNRANNAVGTAQGIQLTNVTDGWISGVEAVSCRGDGVRLDGCTRVELTGCKATDNGRHGFSLATTEFCLLVSARSYDNSQVADAGTGDGINLELFSRYNTIICPVCYETAGVGDRQGYGFREAAASGCSYNVVFGPVFWGNRSGAYTLDSGTSMLLGTPLSTLPAQLILTA